MAQERKPELNKYINELLKLKPSISQSGLVVDFFDSDQVKEDMSSKAFDTDIKQEFTLSENTPGSGAMFLKCFKFFKFP